MQVLDRLVNYGLFRIFCLVIAASAASSSVFALDNTETLPQSINSPSLKYGSVSGIDQKYTQDGKLRYLNDLKSIEFDITTLEKLEPDVLRLVNALKNFGLQDVGNDLNLGILKIETKPEVNYTAPVYARGITETWTLGLGVPVVTYKNKISLTNSGSNIDYYSEQFKDISPKLDGAFKQLSIDLASEAQSQLIRKGYKPIEDHDQTFIGDVQVVSMWRFYESPSLDFVLKSTGNLPTGPKHNPDDLAAINIFSRPYFENILIAGRKLNTSLKAIGGIGYRLNIPQNITLRIPKDANDTLPDESQKEDVLKKVGDSLLLQLGGHYSINDSWSILGGIDYLSKSNDLIIAGGEKDYSLLTNNTTSEAYVSKFSLSYSSIRSFFKKEIPLPLIASLSFSDTFRGKNTERISTSEFTLMLFF